MSNLDVDLLLYCKFAKAIARAKLQDRRRELVVLPPAIALDGSDELLTLAKAGLERRRYFGADHSCESARLHGEGVVVALECILLLLFLCF